jgi:hypothetical protein
LSWALLWPAIASAQTDEIQVYDASIAEVGKTDFTLHSNYTPVGRTAPEFRGAVVADHSTNGAAEFGYGLREYWELGLYLPVYTVTRGGTAEFDGAKLRSLWVTPHAHQREFFYGLNVEYSYNLPHWNPTRTSLELRPIAGWHEGPWDFILNPILDSDFDGLGRMHLAPATRVAYNASSRWAYAVETYSDLGPLQELDGWEKQSQTVYAVVDFTASEATSLEFGVGRGLTSASDPWVVKLIWNRSL